MQRNDDELFPDHDHATDTSSIYHSLDRLGAINALVELRTGRGSFNSKPSRVTS